ncbi:Uncharacterised protein [Mycobacterium tuberculosis]|uniref:Uncharacterized protein n=2 Tax=Mycobacterium tuberculosis TaxID=1773 RepID=A0A916LDU3_MYCTX|nr:Uncharacterised protein [Mycobacterium tuberculosis]
MMAVPTTEPGPGTIAYSARGRPARYSSSAHASAQYGVWLSGLSTTALPATSAGTESDTVSVMG